MELPDALVEARARELWEQMLHTLSHQGISKETYLRITGREEDAIVEEGREDAAQALRREAVLAAIVEAEGIEPTEEEVVEAIQEAGGGAGPGTVPKKVLDRLRSSGRLDELKADLAQRRALDLVAESAKPISVEQAQARDKLWTPDRESAEEGGSKRLWTPGS